MLNSRLHLNVKIKGKTYHAATLGFVESKIELFYHFPWGGKSRSNYSNIGENNMERGYLPDHISFHQDGTIHTKMRDKNKKIKYQSSINPGLNVFNLHRNNFLPILLESIYLHNTDVINGRFKEPKDHDSNSSLCWDIEDRNSFSILLISFCDNVNPEKLIADHGFQNLTFINPKRVLKSVFKANEKESIGSESTFNSNLLILLTENVAAEENVLPTGIHDNSIKLMCRPVTMPPIDMILKMQNYNPIKLR